MGSITYTRVPVISIRLDTKNPRIAQWVEMYGENVSDEAMQLALQKGGSDAKVAGPSYRGLQESIRTNGGVIHPIIVSRDKKGNMTVVEGNTRALIYRNFLATGVPGNWESIPAIVYDDMEPAQVDAIRLQAHLVGAREWDPYSKAKYLNLLRNGLNLPWAQVVDYGGGDQRDLEKLVAAYNDMERYYRPILEGGDQDFDPSRFSGFVELQNPRVYQALVAAGFTKTDFSRWIDGKLLHPLETVRQLPRILQHEQSKKEFLARGAREAIKVLDALERPQQVALAEASLATLAREIYDRVNGIPYGEVVRLRGENESDDRDLIRNALDALTSLWKDITSEGE